MGSSGAIGRHRLVRGQFFSRPTAFARVPAASLRRAADLWNEHREDTMRFRNAIGATALAAALLTTMAGASAQDAAKYPDWSGQWLGKVGGYDPSKPPGRGQQAPLTAEYQAIFEAGLADYQAGGQGNNPTYLCIPPGMPWIMMALQGVEFVVTPKITYVLFTGVLPRRIYTDGRDWPAEVEPGYSGYSIGKWLDTSGNGRFDTLEVETRHMKGPRSFDGATGIPLHKDNETVVKERVYLDKADRDVLHNDVTTFDHALTRPWTANKTYHRQKTAIWLDEDCSENNTHVSIGNQDYLKSWDGLLMPARKDQPPPDLRYFKQTSK
jgi:hypothetical protein